MNKRLSIIFDTILNSYAILFFSQNKTAGFLLLAVSFLNLDAGITGLACVLFAIVVVTLLGFKKELIQIGLYSYNALLLGIGFGTFFNFNVSFWIWLFSAALLSVMLSIGLSNRLGKQGLPFLSLPFVISFWIVLSATNGFTSMGLDQKNSALLNEMSNTGTQNIAGIIYLLKGIRLPFYFDLFFRSLSAIFFQNNVLAGMVISVGILIHSRIALSLMVIGFITACIFNHITGTFTDGISYYHLGSNLMMVSSAIGGFFLIPSARSYLWAVISIVVTILLISAFTRVFGIANLPVFSLPFCVVTIVMLYFLMLRNQPGKLQLTLLQHYSPEINLYQYLNGLERLQNLKYARLNLPFMGSWAVSQGYNGSLTHKGEWDKALDFVIRDEDGQSFKETGTRLEHFYCYNKPVLACADGIVTETVSHIDDNEIGAVNTQQNWGNSIVIKHLDGLYTKVSHLKKNGVKVKTGDFVKQGDVIGLCGNSGRSPEPHLHFQVQTTAYIGSKTLGYPFSYFVADGNHGGDKLQSFAVPGEGAVIHQVEINAQLKQALWLQPGYSAVIETEDGNREYWEVYTDALNQSYIYSKTSGATAYFINNGTAFYFTSFYGSKQSLLFYFYLAAYKIILTADDKITANDQYPMQAGASLWLHDLFAPFYQFMVRRYQSQCINNHNELLINATGYREIFGQQKQVMEATLQVSGYSVKGFMVNINGKITKAKWYTENIH